MYQISLEKAIKYAVDLSKLYIRDLDYLIFCLKGNETKIIGNKYLLNEVTNILKNGSIDTLVDYGCGYSRYSYELSERARRVILIDINYHALDYQRALFLHSPKVSIIMGDIRKTFINNSYLSIVSYVLNYFDSVSEVLNVIKNIATNSKYSVFIKLRDEIYIEGTKSFYGYFTRRRFTQKVSICDIRKCCDLTSFLKDLKENYLIECSIILAKLNPKAQNLNLITYNPNL